MVSGAGPVYDSYVPLFLKEVLHSETLVGIGIGIDNWMVLLLVPFFGAWSDRLKTKLGRRVPFVLFGLVAIAVSFSALPLARSYGAFALLSTILVYSVANAAMRAPMAGLLADLVPSQFRTRANGVASVMMCLGAMPLIATSRMLYKQNPHAPFLLVGALALTVAVVYAFRLREPAGENPEPVVAPPERSGSRGSGAAGFLAELREPSRMLARFLGACIAFHMVFQSFSSWFTMAGAERYGVPVEDCSIGFIVVGAANLLASLPSGIAGARWGRRHCVVVGVAGMVAASLALSTIGELETALFALAIFGASWSLALVNLLPMVLERGGAKRSGAYAGAFLSSMSIGGIVAPLICGAVFDVVGDRSALFVLMAGFGLVSIALLLGLRRGYGETPALVAASG